MTASSAATSTRPRFATLDGLLYCNDGDWVESLTALVETQDGDLRILIWDRQLAPAQAAVRWDDEVDEAPQTEGALV